MKKFFCFLLSATLVFCLFGCCKQAKAPVKPAQFYYCNEAVSFDGNNSVFTPETRETADFTDLLSLMNHYLTGPESPTLISPFPASTEILSINEIGSTLDITFSAHLSELSGSDLTLACVCTAMTLFDLSDTDTILISADGVRLDGKDSIMITPDRLSFTDKQPPEADH